MNDWTDQQLLRAYAESHSEESFTFLASRHVDLVYSAALRMVCDTHTAKDVTQAVFVALAQNAASLSKHPVLSGWLHCTTRNLAAKSIRTNVRRQAREQEAAAMNELLSAESDTSWDDVSPKLDAALGELNEPDRDALLLRYFEKKSAREMAQTLGISDEAAQKRVNRAVDRLREIFSKQGFTLGASGLVALISVNAVQAAPIGIVATISTAVALAATTASTATTITTVKTITMTTLQKTLIAATLAVAVGTGIYEANKASALQRELHISAKRQEALMEDLERLSREHNQATNQLAAASAEAAQWKSGQNPNELFKLRGQIGTLQRQLENVEAKSNSASGIEKILADPTIREMSNQQARREIKLRFAELFQELKLSPEQVDEFAMIVANSGLKKDETVSQGDRVKSLLGEAGYARYTEFMQEVPVRAALKLLKSQLGANQLGNEQATRLWEVVKAEPYDLIYGIEGDVNEALQGSPERASEHLRQVAESHQRIAQQAGNFLTHDQLVALNIVLANALKLQTAQATAFAQKQ